MGICTWKMNRDLFAPKKSSLKYWQVRKQKVAISSSPVPMKVWHVEDDRIRGFLVCHRSSCGEGTPGGSISLASKKSFSLLDQTFVKQSIFTFHVSETVCEKSLSGQPSALNRMRLTLPTLTLDKLKVAAEEP